MEHDFKIGDDIKVQIVRDLIEPFYLDDIKSMIRGKKYWKLTGQVFETVSKILVAVGSVMSFSSGYFDDPLLGFLAGTISTMSLATLQFASFSYIENKKQGKELNILLKKLNLDTIPVLEHQQDSQQIEPSIYSKNLNDMSIHKVDYPDDENASRRLSKLSIDGEIIPSVSKVSSTDEVVFGKSPQSF
jgi:hypothetical protein